MIRKKVLAVMLIVIIAYTVFPANVMSVYAGYDAWVGEIQLYPYYITPDGWTRCTGQLLNINNNNAALLFLIGNNFGGDGSSTFTLPDMKGMEPTNDIGYYIAPAGLYPDESITSNSDYIGDIKLFPYNFDPCGYMHCDGRLLNISDYRDLFALIGTTYGGNGISNFALPDLRSMEPYAHTRYCINPEGEIPSQSSDNADNEAFIGEIHLMAFNFAPKGWAKCDGQLMNISDYQALYSILGAKYGGDASTTFALPNLQAAEPKPGQPGYGIHYYMAVDGYFPPFSD